MKRNRECFLHGSNDDDTSQQLNKYSEETCKRLKEDSDNNNNDGIIILLDQSFNSPPLLKHYHQRYRNDLCNHVVSFLISRICFDQSVLESINFMDRFREGLMGIGGPISREMVLQLLLQYKTLTAGDVKKLTLNFRDDWEVMLTAIRNYHFAVTYASKKLQNNREFAKRSLQANVNCLHWFPKKFHLDREIALESVKNLESCRLMLPLFNDKAFVLDAIKSNIMTIKHVPEELMDDEVISEALKQHSGAIRYLPAHIRKLYATEMDPVDEFLNSPSKKRCSLLDSPYSPIDVNLTQETTLEDLLEYVKRDGLNLRLMNSDCSYDKNIVMEAIKSNGYALKFAANTFRNDRQLVLFALDQPYEKLFRVVEKIDYLGDDIVKDREITLQLLIRAAKHKFEVDWKKFNVEMILFDHNFLMDVYKAIF